jgi:hypothetical protein
MRKKAEAAQQAEAPGPSESSSAPARRCSQTWAMLIKRVYEIDPMICPKCGQSMTIISFIEPPQAEVIEKILKHCGLWKEPASRAPPDTDSLARELDFGFSNPPPVQDLIYEDIDTFLATF